VGGHGNGQLAPPGPSPFLHSSSPTEARVSADGLSGDIWATDFAHIANQQQQNDENLPTDLDTVVPRMMVYPDTGPWLPDSSYNSPFPIAGSLRYLNDHDAMYQHDLSSDEKEHCEKCDQRRQKSTREKLPASNVYRGSNGSNGSSSSSSSSIYGGIPTTGSLLASPISSASASTSPTLSRVMRDHNIELDHLISHATHSRRSSIGGASTEGTGGGSSHSRQLKRRFSGINATAAVGASGVSPIGQPQPQLTTLPNVPEQTQYDVIEKHEYTQGQDDMEDSEAKITKIVVIYMQERQR